MSISAEQIKALRQETGAGIADIKKAVEESGGDMAAARSAIERRLGNLAGKRAGRETRAGIVAADIHSNNKMGTLVELFCETDFVARHSEFHVLAHELAMHIAAMNPDDLPALLAQVFIKDPTKTVGEVINGAIGKFGENITVGRFIRFEI